MSISFETERGVYNLYQIIQKLEKMEEEKE